MIWFNSAYVSSVLCELRTKRRTRLRHLPHFHDLAHRARTKRRTVLTNDRNHEPATDPRRWTPALLAGVALLAAAPLSALDKPLPPVTVGAGVQTSFVHDAPDVGSS